MIAPKFPTILMFCCLTAAMTARAQSPPSGAGTTAATGSADPSPLKNLVIVREKLENGLRVVMSPDRTVPTVAIALYYDVGSRNEVKGKSGFAHLFEHMMFQGSRNVGKMEHFQLITNRGGSANGTTSSDRTNYFERLPSNELELGLWLEADRMRSLAVNQENFENQRTTVMEERRQSYDNQPYMKSMLRINELAYGDYWPYAHSTIGDMEDLKTAPLRAAQEFFASFYPPNNAVLGIAGDFEPEQAMALVRKHFGGIEPREVPAYEPPPLGPQSAERADAIDDPLAPRAAFHIAYHIPPDRSPDHYPLELLAIVLGDGESSRLYQELVKRREMVQEIRVETDGRRGPDLFSFWCVCADGHEGPGVREVIFRRIDEVIERGITERELQKAKNRVRSDFIFALQSNLRRAMRLAEYETYWGDANLLRDEVDRYRSVAAADVKRVAGKYLVAENRTVLDVIPVKPEADGGGAK
jgi:predicted Zn-dependent peptidase